MPERKFFYSGKYLQEHEKEFGDNECILLKLSPSSFYLLADMSRMLLWPTRFEEREVPEQARKAYMEMNNPTCIQVNVDNGDLIEAIERIVSLLSETSEDGDMSTVTQTVNVNCGCGCGCGSQSTVNTSDDNVPPDGYDIPDAIDELPYKPVTNSDKCNRATYLLVQYRNACLSVIQGAEGSYNGFVDWFDGIVGWLVGAIPASYDVYLKVKNWISVGDFTNTDDLINAYDPNFNSLVCAIYSAETPSEARTAVRNILENYVWNEVSVYARLVYKQIFELLPFDMVFDGDVVAELPPGYIGRECCGSVPVDIPDDLPETPTGYIWEPVPYTGEILDQSGAVVSGSSGYGTMDMSGQVGTLPNSSGSTMRFAVGDTIGEPIGLWCEVDEYMSRDQVGAIPGILGWCGLNSMKSVLGDVVAGDRSYTSFTRFSFLVPSDEVAMMQEIGAGADYDRADNRATTPAFESMGLEMAHYSAWPTLNFSWNIRAWYLSRVTGDE